ncbi:MAG: amidinotransferase [Ectothiorhodospiraceae bacterium]|nr:amidinotransferase [Ectothiorhodospiraceae bacterium]
MGVISEHEYRYNMTMKIFHSHPEPAFETPGQQEAVWGRQWGCDNDVGTLRMVLMHRPGEELSIVDPSKRLEHIGSFGDPESGWYWRGDRVPDLGALQAEHDALVQVLRDHGVEVVFLDRCAPTRMKSCYTRDSAIAVKGGAIVTRLGPLVRRGEEAPVTETIARLGMPILRTVHGTGIMEGGSFVWLDQTTAVIGRSNRVNEAGARQVEDVLREQGVELLRVDLTGYRLHIDGALVMVDVATAIINPAQLPFWFLQTLAERGIRTVEICPDDPVSAVNCLAIAPGKVVMSSGISTRTRDALDRLGVEIIETPYETMYLGGGGIHCSTCPLIRDSVY